MAMPLHANIICPSVQCCQLSCPSDPLQDWWQKWGTGPPSSPTSRCIIKNQKPGAHCWWQVTTVAGLQHVIVHPLMGPWCAQATLQESVLRALPEEELTAALVKVSVHMIGQHRAYPCSKVLCWHGSRNSLRSWIVPGPVPGSVCVLASWHAQAPPYPNTPTKFVPDQVP